MFHLTPARLWCTLLSVIVASALPTPDSQSPTLNNQLHTFKYTPATAPIAAIPSDTPLQFNGSEPGQGDVPGQLGWWIPPVTGDPPIDLVSFVQYNKDEGVVFWAERTLFELYLALAEVAGGTYAVKLGQPNTETPEPGLAGNWTITKIDDGKYGFGWKGNYTSWFVCEKGNGYYGLYFGKVLEGCGDPFVLQARYQPSGQ